jgi:hypothetical protein
MKNLIFLLATLTIINLGCTKKDTDNQVKNSAMLVDSSYTSDKDVTVLHAKDTIRISESMKNFGDNPNITQRDIDAEKRIESNEVQYIKKGDTIRISEKVRETRK